MSLKQAVRTGLIKGLQTTWELGIVVVPVSIGVSLLKYTSFFEVMAERLAPVMGVFGLPGEAAVVLIFGYLLNIYSGIGALLPLQLSIEDITVIGFMLGFAHTLPVETVICKKAGGNSLQVLGVRLGTSLFCGVMAGIFS